MTTAPHIETATLATVAPESDFVLLTGFLRQLSPAAKSAELTEETALLSSGILDSLGILQLMTFLGDELGIEIDDEDFTLDNFETIGTLLTFIRQRSSSP